MGDEGERMNATCRRCEGDLLGCDGSFEGLCVDCEDTLAVGPQDGREMVLPDGDVTTETSH